MFQFNELPTLVKNIIIINIIFYVATVSLASLGINLVDYFGLHQIQSSKFYPYQLITHFFMHGSIPHLFFNMFALWMFGKTLENIWGPKRFLIYYFVTALGAALLHILVTQLKISNLMFEMNISDINAVIENGANILQNRQNYINGSMSKLNLLINIPTVGASGAVFGVFFKQKLAKKPLTIVGNGNQSRDFIYVSDVANAFYKAAITNKTSEIYNLGNDRPMSINKLANLIGG